MVPSKERRSEVSSGKQELRKSHPNPCAGPSKLRECISQTMYLIYFVMKSTINAPNWQSTFAQSKRSARVLKAVPEEGRTGRACRGRSQRPAERSLYRIVSVRVASLLRPFHHLRLWTALDVLFVARRLYFPSSADADLPRTFCLLVRNADVQRRGWTYKQQELAIMD